MILTFRTLKSLLVTILAIKDPFQLPRGGVKPSGWHRLTLHLSLFMFSSPRGGREGAIFLKKS